MKRRKKHLKKESRKNKPKRHMNIRDNDTKNSCDKDTKETPKNNIESIPTAPSKPAAHTNQIVEQQQQQQQQQKRQKEEVAKRFVPMSREEYEKQQSRIRQVYDPESGRYRLVRGSGEIIESIVSREDHLRINQQATRGDGASFARSTFRAAKRV
jgi:hypothetical protein